MRFKNDRLIFRYTISRYLFLCPFVLLYCWGFVYSNLAFCADASVQYIDPVSLQPLTGSPANISFAGYISYNGVERWLAVDVNDSAGSASHLSNTLGGAVSTHQDQALILPPSIANLFDGQALPNSVQNEHFLIDPTTGVMLVEYDTVGTYPPDNYGASPPNEYNVTYFDDDATALSAAQSYAAGGAPPNTDGYRVLSTGKYPDGNLYTSRRVLEIYYAPNAHYIYNYFAYLLFPQSPTAQRLATPDDFRRFLENLLGNPPYSPELFSAVNELLDKIRNSLSPSSSDQANGYTSPLFKPEVKDQIEAAINDPGLNPAVEGFKTEVDSMTPEQLIAAQQPQFVAIDPGSMSQFAQTIADAVGSIELQGGATAAEIEAAIASAEAANNPILADLFKQALLDTQQPALTSSDIELGVSNALASEGAGSSFNSPVQPVYDSSLDIPVETDLVPIIDDGVNSVLSLPVVQMLDTVNSLTLVNSSSVIACTLLGNNYELDFSKYESYLDLFGNLLYAIVVVTWTISLFI